MGLLANIKQISFNYVKIMPMILEEEKNIYQEYAPHMRDNELEIISSDRCCCLNCRQRFSARMVHNWYNDKGKNDASCPYCGLPYVIGDASNLPLEGEKFEEACNQLDAEQTPEKRREDMIHFCVSFYNHEFDDSQLNESLYESYLQYIYEEFQDATAAISLARLYARGLTYIAPNTERAIELYRENSLRGDENALYELGVLYDNRGAEGDDKKAFEAFSRAAALGSISASIFIADYYLHGKYVEEDQTFAVSALLSIVSELYPKVFVNAIELTEFVKCTYNLAVCFYNGIGCQENHTRALRYLLLSAYACESMAKQGGAHPETEAVMPFLDKLISNEFPRMSDTMVFDEDTFFDSFFEQYDNLAHMRFDYVEYNREGSLHLGISSNRPMMIVDLGNAYAQTFFETEWTMPNVKYEIYGEERRFERIEFEGFEAVNFYHTDPMVGESLVLRLVFPPAPQLNNDEEEDA